MSKFKKGQTVYSPEYGIGKVVNVNPKETKTWRQKNGKIIQEGVVYVHFDDQEQDRSPIAYTMDGRSCPEGSGYFWAGRFNPFFSEISLEPRSE